MDNEASTMKEDPPLQNETEMRRTFEKYGKIQSLSVFKGRKHGAGTFVFVYFFEESSAQQVAREMKGCDVEGNRIKIQFDGAEICCDSRSASPILVISDTESVSADGDIRDTESVGSCSDISDTEHMGFCSDISETESVGSCSDISDTEPTGMHPAIIVSDSESSCSGNITDSAPTPASPGDITNTEPRSDIIDVKSGSPAVMIISESESEYLGSDISDTEPTSPDIVIIDKDPEYFGNNISGMIPEPAITRDAEACQTMEENTRDPPTEGEVDIDKYQPTRVDSLESDDEVLDQDLTTTSSLITYLTTPWKKIQTEAASGLELSDQEAHHQPMKKRKHKVPSCDGNVNMDEYGPTTVDSLELDEDVHELNERVKSSPASPLENCETAHGLETSEQRTHNVKKSYMCKCCRKTFSSANTLIHHGNIVSSRNALECLCCFKKFLSLNEWKIHEFSRTNGKTFLIEKLEKPFMCEYCFKCFTMSDAVQKHVLYYQCDVCGEGLKCRSIFYNHAKLHGDITTSDTIYSGKEPYRCQYCGQCFTQLESFQRHTLDGAVEDAHKCEDCGIEIKCIFKLDQHMQTHKVEYKCGICGVHCQSVLRLSLHKKNMHTHRPFKCRFCNKTFKSKSYKKLHVLVCASSKRKNRLLKCKYCDKTFSTVECQKKHLRVQHARETPFECEYCGVLCMSIDNLKEHRKSHTGPQPYVCTVCRVHFSSLGLKKRHAETHIRSTYISVDGKLKPMTDDGTTLSISPAN